MSEVYITIDLITTILVAAERACGTLCPHLVVNNINYSDQATL